GRSTRTSRTSGRRPAPSSRDRTAAGEPTRSPSSSARGPPRGGAVPGRGPAQGAVAAGAARQHLHDRLLGQVGGCRPGPGEDPDQGRDPGHLGKGGAGGGGGGGGPGAG